MRTPSTRNDGPQSVRRALELLFLFSVDRTQLTVSQLAEDSGLNRATAYRIMGALLGSGLVRRDSLTGLYSLAPRVLRLSEVFLHQLHDLRAVALTGLTHLRDVTGETAALHVRDDFTRVVIDQVESRHEIRRTYPDLGEYLPLHQGAPSVAILAFLEPEEQDRYLVQAPDRWSDFTESDTDVVRLRMAEARKYGFARSLEQRTSGVSSVAAPLFDWTGRVIGAVNVSGPMQRMTAVRALTYAPLVMKVAAEISADLGHERSGPEETRVGAPSVTTNRGSA